MATGQRSSANDTPAVCPGGRCGGCMSRDRLSPGGGGMSGGAISTRGHGPEGVAS